MFDAVAVIPARYSSVRLPGKPLLLIDGIPLICRVYNAVTATGLFKEVIVATDNELIFKTVENYGGKVLMTSDSCESGTERIVEISSKIGHSLIVNVQGDEPFIGKKELESLLSVFEDEQVQIASLMSLFDKTKDYLCIDNQNQVKVVIDNNDYALYFSRSKIPYNRDSQEEIDYYRHIGVYAFRKEILDVYSRMKRGKLEQIEKLEQLRWLENGYRIKMISTSYDGFGIDTQDDLIAAERIIRQRSRSNS